MVCYEEEDQQIVDLREEVDTLNAELKQERMKVERLECALDLARASDCYCEACIDITLDLENGA